MLSGNRLRGHHRILLVLALLALIAPSCRKPGYKVVVGKEGKTHIVSRGESLESIAQMHYGDKDLGKALGEYNGVDPLAPLEPGRSLIVPFDRTELEHLKTMQDANVFYNRGTMLAKTGQYEEASRYLESAVEANSAHVDAWYNLALVYHQLEKPEKALGILTRLIETYPSEETYHYSLGASLRQAKRNTEAIEAFKEALEIAPKYREAQYALALTYEDLSRLKQARQAWERYLELDQDTVWSDEARMHLQRLKDR